MPGRLVGLAIIVAVAAPVLCGRLPAAPREAPLTEPTLFAPGIVSTPMDEFGGAFTPDGQEFYYGVSVPRSYLYAICVTRYRDGRWTMPEVASFSGTYRDFDPFITQDGRQLFFVSDRPVDARPKHDYDIWVVERQGDGWGVPRNLGAPVNTESHDEHPSVTADGTLYFGSTRPGGRGGFDIYRAVKDGASYREPENLDDAVNTPFDEVEPAVTSDERVLVVASWNRPDSVGGEDLYVSERRDERWQPAKNAGPVVNSPSRDYSPTFTHDGRTLIFASERQPPGSLDRLLTYGDLRDRGRETLGGWGNVYLIGLRALGVADTLPSTRARAAGPASTLMNEPMTAPMKAAMTPPMNAPVPALVAAPVPTGVDARLTSTTRDSSGGPALVGEGIISTPLDEVDGAPSPDGREWYFTVRTAATSGVNRPTICFSRSIDGRWSPPQVAPFSGQVRDSGPAFSPDGAWLYFTSNRAVGAERGGAAGVKRDADI